MAIQFKIKLAPAISTAIVLPILMSLGFWQLDRAELKQQALDTHNTRAKQGALEITGQDKPALMKTEQLQYAQLSVTGHYDVKHSFLIDNRVHQGQVGFYVITPFIIENSSNAVLVNRGWIKAKRYRKDLPEFSTSSKKIRLNGLGYVPSENFFAVDNVKIDVQKLPAIIQKIDFAAIGEIINMDVYPFVLRLDPKDSTGFVREWTVVNSSPEKSQSYAAQWFTMALVVIILFLSSCINIKRENAA